MHATTEAGIVFDNTDKFELDPPNTYPGKLCKFLYTRYKHFNISYQFKIFRRLQEKTVSTYNLNFISFSQESQPHL